MIDLYYWTTPNGHKITIFLEEAGLPYTIHPINIGKGEQFSPEFLQISPNNRIPAIVDNEPLDGAEPISVFESGAILLYLADKTKQFIAQDLRGRIQTIEWLFWQVAGLGPMNGQNAHFTQHAPEIIPYAVSRYVKETNRLFGVLNRQLSSQEFIAGNYSIADMACFPWVMPYELLGQNLDDFPHLQRWFDTVSSREAVLRAYNLVKDINPNPGLTEEAKSILFGQDANSVK